MADQRMLRSWAGDVAADRGERDPGPRDRAVLDVERGAGGRDRPVADPAIDLQIGAPTAVRDTDLREDLRRADRGLVRALVELVHVHHALLLGVADHERGA